MEEVVQGHLRCIMHLAQLEADGSLAQPAQCLAQLRRRHGPALRFAVMLRPLRFSLPACSIIGTKSILLPVS
jgi:hypothetical protein